ncbi:MAG: DUF1573 domain-containing protein, partial [Candidatus Hydrogenedentes bacterium]|nr:DUF1573 domain-containing protein [Candidatus Hydrogenedentota bacterium]
TAQASDAAQTVAGAYPRIELETDLYDMGVISNDSKGEGRIKVYNRGGAPLKISKVNTSCGCTTGTMSADVIEPGGEAYINVIVDPFRIPRFDSTKILTVESNDPANDGKASVKVKAKVTPEIAWEPEKVDFGDIEKGQSPERTVRVRQVSDEKFELLNVEGSDRGRFFDVSYSKVPKDAWRTPGRAEYDMRLSVKPSAQSGPRRMSLTMTTNLRRLKRVNYSVAMNVIGVYSVDPQTVTLRSIKAGQKIESVLTVSSEKPLEMLSAESGNDSLKMSYRDGDAPNTYVFDVNVAENMSARLQQDVWKLKLRCEGKEYTEVVKVLGVLSADAVKAANQSKAAPHATRQPKPVKAPEK